jgi:hypothetical protein
MNREPQPSDTEAPLTNTEDEITGLPLLPTWRRVYWFVLVVFVAYVVLLSALPKVFA